MAGEIGGSAEEDPLSKPAVACIAGSLARSRRPRLRSPTP